VFFAKQDDARHQKVQIGRAERTRPANSATRVVAGSDQIDISLAVDLAAAQEKRIDASLCGKVE
jgi:hypothetical protein